MNDVCWKGRGGGGSTMTTPVEKVRSMEDRGERREVLEEGLHLK